MARFTRYWKTIIALVPVVVFTGNEIVQAIDNDADGSFTAADSYRIALVGLTALAVYAKANTPPAGEHSDPNVSETSA